MSTKVASYVYLIISFLAVLISSIMLAVTIKSPKALIRTLDSGQTEFLFTFRGRYSMDVILSLLLFAMGEVGFFFGSMTIILIFMIRLVGVRHKEAFNQVFRPPPGFDDDTIVSDIEDDAGAGGGDYELQ